MNGILCDLHAKEVVGIPDWEVYLWDCRPHGGPVISIELTGAVAPMMPKAKRRNWRLMEKATMRTVAFTLADQEEWERRWSERTGNCRTCLGDGKVLVSLSVKDGPLYCLCPECDGTGQSPRPAGEGA